MSPEKLFGDDISRDVVGDSRRVNTHHKTFLLGRKLKWAFFGFGERFYACFLCVVLVSFQSKALLLLCQKYGTQAILWKRKFIGLLPEVNRRSLYEKKKCSSVHEFAAKFGGVTKKHTQRVIQIDKAFEEKGVKMLREMLQEGAASINKLAKVVSIIGVIDEEELVAAIKKLSCRSLETYVVDLRQAFGNDENIGGAQIQDGLFEPLFEGKSVHVNTFADGAAECSEKVRGRDELGIETEGAGMAGTNMAEMQNQNVALKKLRLNLSAETLEELLELQGKGIDIDVLLREFLQNREENIAEKKEGTVRKVTGREKKRRSEGKKPIRQISVGVKKILKEEFGTKCAVGGCKKEATQIHHTVPFSINGSNSPDLLRPLCRAHHDIVHSVNAAYVEKKGMG